VRVNNGADFQSIAMGGGLSGETGTATNTTATTLTTNSAVSHVTNDLAGVRVIATSPNPPVEGVVISNTSGVNTILTVDRWVQPGTSTVASTPSATTIYAILSGAVPGRHIALSTNATAPNATDTALTGELNNAGGGLNRAKGTYSHTLGTSSYSLTNTYTANSSDGASNTIQKIGVFNSIVPVTGIMIFESAVVSPPTLVSGDTLAITETVNL
jgi:hypothetical protein